MSRSVPLADRAPLSTLGSLLAAHGVPTRRIEEAIARQIVHGSDLATNLLEVGGVTEELLLKVLAEASGLEPAPLGSLIPSAQTALVLVSGDTAHELNIIPLMLEGTVLTLVVAEPFLSPEQLGFPSAIDVVQIIAPLPRIRQAISRSYRIPLDRRFTRLLGKLGEPGASSSRFEFQDEPTQVSGIPLVELGITRPPTQTPATLLAGGASKLQAVPAKHPPTKHPPAVERPPPPVNDADEPTTVPHGGIKHSVGEPTIPQTVPGDVALAKGNAPAWATRAPLVQVVEPPAGWRPVTSDDMPETIPAPRLSSPGVKAEIKAELKTDSKPEPKTQPKAEPRAEPKAEAKETNEEEGAPVSRRTAGLLKRETARGRAAGGLFRRTVVGEAKAREQARQAVAEPPSPHERRTSVRVRRKGPFTAQAAEEELAEAATNDLVLDVLFAFAQQFFEYTVLFVVSGEWADGRDASGPGLTATQIKNVKIPLDQPSLLQLARDRKAPVTAPPVSHGIDVQIIRDLAREARFADGYRAAVAVLPIVVRNRVVALLLGDDGVVDVDLSALGDVIIILGRTVEAIERVILRKKFGAAGRTPSVFPPGMTSPDHGHDPGEGGGLRPVGLAALARALDTSTGVDSERLSESDVASLPPTKSAPTATLLSPAAMRSTESPGFTVHNEPPDVLPRSPRPTGRAGGTNRRDSTSSSDESSDEDGPEPAEPIGPASRRRRYSNVSNARPRLAPSTNFDSTTESTVDMPQQTLPGVPRSQKRGPATGFGRSRLTVGPRPLPPNIGASKKAAVRVPPARAGLAESATPTTLVGPPLPPTVQARRLGGTAGQTNLENLDPVAQLAERETVSLLQRFVESRGTDNDAGQTLVQMGPRALAAIMDRFPGPLAPGVEREALVLPPAAVCGPLLALLVALGNDAVLRVAQRATSILSEDRFWSAHVLGAIPSVESAEVAATLLFDDDVSVRRVARHATMQLLTSVPEAESVVAPMLEQVASSLSERSARRLLAFEALGKLAIPSTVPALIALLADPVRDFADATHRTLVQITCQDFGHDTRRWFDWFGANASRHRVEWIMDSLMHESVELRRIAAEALAPFVGRDLGYDAYESRNERAAAHVRYLLWWEQEGRVQFGE